MQNDREQPLTRAKSQNAPRMQVNSAITQKWNPDNVNKSAVGQRIRFALTG